MPDRLRLQRSARRLLRDEQGGVALMFVFMLPVLAGLAGAATEYASLSAQRTRMQAVADSAALAGAREFRLGNASITTLNQAVIAHASGSMLEQEIEARIVPQVNLKERSITVTLMSEASTLISSLIMRPAGINTRLTATATARMVGGAPICVVGLNETATSTVALDKNARLEAPDCAVYSNSRKNSGISAKNSAVLKAAFICSAGGKAGAGPGSFSPSPQTDCPVLPDPLAQRSLPVPGPCLRTNFIQKGGAITLIPGTYCGGVTLDSNARVTMTAGTYVFLNGPLVVTGGASLSGVHVALHFSGVGAVLKLEALSSISLAAPRSGQMAGMLITEDRLSPAGQTHEIMSDDAGTLLGTIYLSRGRLHVGANKPVAERSAYTIVVADRFTLSEGPTMVLNTNYSATDIPVPDGVGPGAGKALLSQ
jgi:Flp pilus assembly protein TadG